MSSIRDELIEKYMEIARGFYFEGSDEKTERNEYAPKFADEVIEIFNKDKEIKSFDDMDF